jgi:hypothetical protein
MSNWAVSALPSGVACPLPQALDHATARKHFNDVRKDMPHLSPAAARREAARRAGVDYDTFLRAWKKDGAVIRPPSDPTPPPGPVKPPVPPGTVAITTRDEARAFERKIAKERGLKPGTAESRKAAADAAGMRYDDFLGIWKGQKPAIPTSPRPDPIPAPVKPPAVAKPSPSPVQIGHSTRSIKKYLNDRGFRESKTGKVRRTHTGAVYGGGAAETEGFDLSLNQFDGNIDLRWRPGSASASETIKALEHLKKDLEAAGFEVKEGLTRLHLIIKKPDLRISPVGPVRRLRTYKKDPADLISDRLNLKMSNQLQRQAMQAEIKDQMEYSGTVGDRLRGVKHVMDDSVANDLQNDRNILAYYRPGALHSSGRTLYFGESGLRSGGGVEQARMETANWFSKCTENHALIDSNHGVRSTFAHEFGHFLDDVINTDPSGRDPRVALMNTIREDMDLSREEWAAFQLGQNKGMVGGVHLSDSIKRKVSEKVSRYGSTNYAEMFAEIWAEYTRNPNGARPLIKKWGTMIQDILEAMQ